MTQVIRIDTNGDILRLLSGDLLQLARQEFAHTTVVTCRLAPILEPLMPPSFVMVIDDFGAEDMPLNEKAWALYGRSPIFGSAYFAYDSNEGGGRPDLPEQFIDMIKQPLETWVAAGVIEYMKNHADRPDMLTPRPE